MRLSHTPFADSLDADARIYWAWSEAILRGGWIPPAPLFLAPLYPYALAVIRAVGGGSIGHALAAQALLGAGTVVLLADATRRLAGRRAALIVGAILALFQPTTFFGALVLPESPLLFVESLLVWFVARTDWRRAGAGRCACYGALAGVLAQGRASDAVLLVLIVPLAWAGRPPLRRRLIAATAALATFALCCAPATLINARASRELIPFTYSLGFNLYVGNNPDATGAYVDVTGGSIPVPLAGTSPVTGGALDGRAYVLASEGRRLGAAESSRYWATKAAAFVRSHAGATLRLAGKKLLLAWNRRETPQIETMASFARAAGPLGIPWVGSFAFLAILGLAGVAWASRGGGAERWFVGYLALMSLAMTPFFVTERYRLHLVPALAVLAGIALAGIARVARDRTRTRAAAALAVASAIVCAPIGATRAGARDWGVIADRAMRLTESGSYEEALAAFASADSAIGAVRAASLSTSARTDLAAFDARYGIALEAVGRHDEAIARWERAVTLDPNDAVTLGRLNVAYETAGRTGDVARVCRMLEAAPGGRGQIMLDDGWSSAGRGDLADAERQFGAALDAAPDLAMAWYGLVRLRVQTGRLDEAATTLDRARGAGLDPRTADIFDGYLRVRRGDLAGARRALDRVPDRAASADPYLVGLLEFSRGALSRRGTGPPIPSLTR